MKRKPTKIEILIHAVRILTFQLDKVNAEAFRPVGFSATGKDVENQIKEVHKLLDKLTP